MVRKLIWEPTEICPLHSPEWNCSCQVEQDHSLIAKCSPYPIGPLQPQTVFTSFLQKAIFHWFLHCHALLDFFDISLSPSSLNHLSLLRTYWDLLGLCFWPSFLAILYLLHGPSHLFPDLHANDSQISISSPFSSYLSWFYQTACDVLNATPFSQAFLIEHFQQCQRLVPPCHLPGKFLHVDQAPVAHCSLSYALLDASRRLCLHSLIVMPKAMSTDHLESTCLRVFVVEGSAYLSVSL